MKSISFCCLVLTLLLSFVYAKDDYTYALFDKDKSNSVMKTVEDLVLKNKDTYEDKKKFEQEQEDFERSRRGAAFNVGDYAYVRRESEEYPIFRLYVNPKILEMIKAVPGVIIIDDDKEKMYAKYSELYENKKPENKVTATTAASTAVTPAKATNTTANKPTSSTTSAATNNANKTDNNNTNNAANNAAPVNNNAAPANNNATPANNNVNNSITNGNSTATTKPINATSGVSSNTVFKISNVLIAIFAIYLFH
ncbi:hypothetical protein PIROE2DRAFT_9662 [Piromyces sp. E2]|nr:hypothetical protein PIROE2DRAFT_9662 [Piromyces sp. E2]|eukprot:OUM63724.1 hypothetical protein PIROE2DRAFT_9662 [Piromyces sp. E2]